MRATYLRALGRYVPEPVDGIPAVLIRATEGGRGDPPLRAVYRDPRFGWGELLGDSIEVVDVQGSHATMLQSGRVGAIVALLAERIGRCA